MAFDPEKSSDIFKSMIEEGEDAIVLLDELLKIKYMNKAFLKAFELDFDAGYLKPFPVLFESRDNHGTCDLFMEAGIKNTCSFHGVSIRNTRNNISKGPFCISCTLMSQILDDEQVRMVVFRDMSPLADYIQQIEDISQWVEDERSYLNEILDGIADGYYVTDTKGKIRRINTKLEQMLGLNSSDILGKTCSEIFNSGHCEKDCPIHWVKTNEKPILRTREIITFNNRRFFIRKSTFPIRNYHQKVTGFISIIYDDSELETLRHTLGTQKSGIPLSSNNKRIKEIFSLIQSMRETDASILLTGESGTGKEIISEAIVNNSLRSNKPFLKINCSALPEGLLESELFGHRRGAFTGAVADKPGKFTVAHGGTILLDEIGDMPLPLQAKLLRVLESGEFQPVGAIKTQKTDVRVIAATNQNLQQLIQAGRFREDLYYRICVVPIEIPALRYRKEDIPELVRSFIELFNGKYKKHVNDVSSRALSMLMGYQWPGNIRELRNAIEHAFACSQTDTLERANFPITIRQATDSDTSIDPLSSIQTITNHRKLTRDQLLLVLNQHKGNRQKTADILRISRTTLWRKMKEFGLSEFR